MAEQTSIKVRIDLDALWRRVATLIDPDGVMSAFELQRCETMFLRALAESKGWLVVEVSGGRCELALAPAFEAGFVARARRLSGRRRLEVVADH